MLAATGAPVAAQDPAPVPPPPAPADIRHRGELFGDWGGARQKLGEKQTKIDVSYTQFFDWVPVGDDNRGFDYGGKIDVKGEANLSKSLWDGFSVGGHFEMRYGDVPLLAGGTLIPTSTALLFPESDGTHAARHQPVRQPGLREQVRAAVRPPQLPRSLQRSSVHGRRRYRSLHEPVARRAAGVDTHDSAVG